MGSLAPLHYPACSGVEESVGRGARLVTTASAFPMWKESSELPRCYFSYIDRRQNGQQVITESQGVECIVCRNSCAESENTKRLFLKEASEECLEYRPSDYSLRTRWIFSPLLALRFQVRLTTADRLCCFEETGCSL